MWKDNLEELFSHSSFMESVDDDVTSLATVSSLRQHPPVSPVSCIEPERRCKWFSGSGETKDGVLSSCGKCSPPLQQCTNRNLLKEDLFSTSILGDDPVDDPQIRSALSHPDLDCTSAPAARVAEWIPLCSSCCSTSWLRTSWSAGGCSTADRETNPAKLRDQCRTPGVCVCVCTCLGTKICIMSDMYDNDRSTQWMCMCVCLYLCQIGDIF